MRSPKINRATDDRATSAGSLLEISSKSTVKTARKIIKLNPKIKLIYPLYKLLPQPNL